MKIKKCLAFISALAMTMSILSACGNSDADPATQSDLPDQSEELISLRTEVSVLREQLESATATTTEITENREDEIKSVSLELYTQLNQIYDDCNLYSELLFAQINMKKNGASVKKFCDTYPVPYDFVRNWFDTYYEEYRNKHGEEYMQIYFDYPEDYITPQEQQDFVLMESRCDEMIASYLISINWYNNVESNLDSSKEMIQRINSSDVDTPYKDTLIDYYTTLSSYFKLTQDSTATVLSYQNSMNEIKSKVETFKAELELYL